LGKGSFSIIKNIKQDAPSAPYEERGCALQAHEIQSPLATLVVPGDPVSLPRLTSARYALFATVVEPFREFLEKRGLRLAINRLRDA
jgi:hypothetical protein